MCIARWEKDKRSHIGHRVAVAQGWYERSGPGAAGTIQLFHIISARPSEQPLMVRTFLKVYMELDSYFLFLQEQIKDIIIIIMQSFV